VAVKRAGEGWRQYATAGAAVQTKAAFPCYDEFEAWFPVAENLLNRNFTVSAPNQVLVSDITYLPSRCGWLYLTVFYRPFFQDGRGMVCKHILSHEPVPENGHSLSTLDQLFIFEHYRRHSECRMYPLSVVILFNILEKFSFRMIPIVKIYFRKPFAFNVPKNDSATALSQQFPFRLMLGQNDASSAPCERLHSNTVRLDRNGSSTRSGLRRHIARYNAPEPLHDSGMCLHTIPRPSWKKGR